MNLVLWFSGNGNPTIAADPHDHYLDMVSGNVWMFSGTLLGNEGSLWFSGHGNPAIAAKVNDYYIDVDTADIWAFS